MSSVLSKNTALLIREALALLLLGVLLMLVAALYSFDASDVSWNHGSEHAVHNVMGLAGSYIADLLYQLLGLGSWFVVVLGAIWAWRVAWGRKPYTTGWTAWFWLPFLLSALGLLSLHDAPTAWLPSGLGGALGMLLADALVQEVSIWGAHGVLLAVSLSSFVLASQCSLMLLARRGWVVLRMGMHQRKEVCAEKQAQQYGDDSADVVHDMEAVVVSDDVMDEPALPKEPVLLEPIPIEPEVPLMLDALGTDAVAAEVQVLERQDVEQICVDVMQDADSDTPFVLPSLRLFPENKQEKHEYSPEVLTKMSRLLEQKLLEYKVEGRVVAVQPGPVVLQFELELAPGTKSAKVVGLQADLARSMAAYSVRVVGNIPGKNVIGIELPNVQRETVIFREVLASPEFQQKNHILPLALGVDIAGKPVVVDLAKMPHLLVAGTTGSGKSVAVNAMICSMLMTHTPKTLRLIMVDPKMLELSMYDDIPHLLVPVVTSPHKANKALAWSVFEMERRYVLMSEAKVRNLAGYNEQVRQTGEGEALPLIVIIIDELADLMMVAGKEVEQSICRIAQKARAAGLHLVLATQRPSVDVITGLIKANLPSRLSCKVSSKIDSRTILDQMGAEQLLGQGDSLFLNGGSELTRVHGAFVPDQAVMDVVEHLKTQGAPDYREEVLQGGLDEDDDALGGMQEEKDDRYDEAAALVVEKGKCSVSMVQRYLRVGYNRASRIVEQMEQDGLVTPPGSGGQRKVLAKSEGGVME